MSPDRLSSERSIRIRYVVLVAANLLASVVGFATAALIAQRFDASGFGEVSLAISVVTYALLVANFGTEIFAVKSIAARTHSVAEMASSVAVVRFALAGPTYLLLVALAYLVPSFAEIRPLLTLLGLSVFASAASVVWVSQAIHRTGVFATAALATEVLYLGGLYLGLEFVSDIRLVPLARIAAEAITVAALLVWIITRVGPLARPLPARELWALLRSAAPIGGTQLFRGVALGSDLIVLGFFVSLDALGHYSAAFKIYMGLTGLASAYFLILLPRVAERHADPSAVLTEIHSSFRRILPLFIAGSAFVAVFARPALEFLFGDSFGAATPSLRILLTALVVSTAYRHYRMVLIARGLQQIDLRTTVAGGLVHLAVKLALVPWLGILGAAVGSLLGELYLLIVQRRAALADLKTGPGNDAS